MPVDTNHGDGRSFLSSLDERWVVFDYGLVISEHTAALPDLADLLGVSLAELEPRYWAFREEFDRGWTDLEYWRTVGEACGSKLDFDEATTADLAKRDADGWLRVDPATVELIEGLAGDGVRLAVLSNAPSSFARLAEQQPWARHFQHLLFSGDVGLIKPDAAIYELLLTRLGAAAADCVFFDDRQSNVDGAKAVGLHAHLWKGAAEARTALSAPWDS